LRLWADVLSAYQAQFRLGFTENSDCYVPLIASFAEASTASARLWRGDSEREFDRILAALGAQESRSHHKERVHVHENVTILGIPIGSRGSMFDYEVRVFREDLARAKAAIA
jgi:hypothetical protein